MANKEQNPAVEAAKSFRDEDTHLVELFNGMKARLVPVPPAILTDVMSRLSDPQPPTYANPEYPDRPPEPNYEDPAYKKALDEVEKKRAAAVLDALVMFGVELVDPIPEDKVWLKQLQWMEKRGELDLSMYNMEDPFELEFVFKRYVLCTGDIINELNNISNISAGDVDAAGRSFRRFTKRNTH